MGTWFLKRLLVIFLSKSFVGKMARMVRSFRRKIPEVHTIGPRPKNQQSEPVVKLPNGEIVTQNTKYFLVGLSSDFLHFDLSSWEENDDCQDTIFFAKMYL